MSEAIIVAIITLVGNVIMYFVANSKTVYRIDQLEGKVNKHNNLIERMYQAEQDITLLKNEVQHIEEDNR